jgi:hypothetical protein
MPESATKAALPVHELSTDFFAGRDRALEAAKTLP